MLKYFSCCLFLMIASSGLAGTSSGGGSTMGLVIGNSKLDILNSVSHFERNSFLPFTHLGQAGEVDIVSLKSEDYKSLLRSSSDNVLLQLRNTQIPSTKEFQEKNRTLSIITEDDKEILVISEDSLAPISE